MKKTARILSLITLLILIMTQFASAAGLEIVKVTPADGDKGKQVSNMAVKVEFSENMIDPAAIANNGSKFSITDAEGNKQPFQIVYSEEKYPNELWLILEGELVSDSEYTFKVEPGVTAKSGSVLEKGLTTTFKTRNTKTDSRISTLLMFGMMGVMFYTTSKTTKKMAEEQGTAGEVKQYNPYKMAKEKGISVEEAKQIIAKEKEKDAKKAQAAAEKKKAKDEALAAEVAARQKELEEEYEAARHARNYQVKGPRSIKEAGGTVPKSVIKKNKAKRAAREKAAKK